MPIADIAHSIRSPRRRWPAAADETAGRVIFKSAIYTNRPGGGQGVASINLAGNLLGVGDNIRLEMFENSLADVPFYTNDFTNPNPTDQFGVSFSRLLDRIQGVIRLTALSRSINVDNIVITVDQAILSGPPGCCGNSNKYVQTFDFSTPVSVPGPIAGAGLPGILFAGGGLLAWWCRKRKAQAAA